MPPITTSVSLDGLHQRPSSKPKGKRRTTKAISNIPKTFPLHQPPISLKDIRRAIPSHLFTRPLLRSLYYLAVNLLIVSILFYVGSHIPNISILNGWLSYFLWPIYWFLQGSYLTGIWVIAHECGHQGFSDYKGLNDFIGIILHSLLLVPYDSWKITHRRHHSNTGSCDHDEVFVPKTRSAVTTNWNEYLEESPIYTLFQIIFMLTVGWIPGYLVFNASGPPKYANQNANHFSPNAIMFSQKEKYQIHRTLVAYMIAIGILAYIAYQITWIRFVQLYFIPYLIVNAYLVLITYLQHTDVYVPHFREEEWNWFRGALCTVDRSFGSWLNGVLHHITDSHVCHHLFSTMPFYHAIEATPIVEKMLGEFYMKDETPIFQALFRAHHHCKFVEDDEKIVFYKQYLKD